VLSAFTVCETVQVNAVLVSSVKQIASHKLVMCQLVQCVDKDNKLHLCRHSYSVHHSKCFKLGCRAWIRIRPDLHISDPVHPYFAQHETSRHHYRCIFQGLER